jgi:uncharacterized iron-regulated protein
MATTATTRRVSAQRASIQRAAVARVEQAIRSAVRPPRSRYLAEFTDAFRAYKEPLSEANLLHRASAADVVLVGDYHSLTPCQTFLTTLLGQLANRDSRPNVLGLEAIYSTSQSTLDDWWHGRLDEDTLKSRLRFARDWGYDWQPYSEILTTACQHCHAVQGLDSEPRFDLRRVRARDRHMAARILEMRRTHPKARSVIFVGESHLAPEHLPRLLHNAGVNTFTILQNVDALYWQAQELSSQKTTSHPNHPQPVSVTAAISCVFNASPLEKYESYHQYLERQ